MLSHFSFMAGEAGQKFARCRVSEVTRPQQELVRLFLAHSHGPKERASSTK